MKFNLSGLTQLKFEISIPPTPPLKKWGTSKAHFLRGLGDLCCVSPIYVENLIDSFMRL